MNVLSFLNGCLDAGDLANAAACILADPVSTVLERRSVERLYSIAFEDFPTTRKDALMIEIIADVMTARARQ